MNLNKKIIMVVDDDRTHRSLMNEIVEGAGFKVITADSGQSAIDHLHNYGENVSLILLDYEMPGMNGVETVKEIREGQNKGSWPRIPVIAFTANREDESKEQCLAAGMDDFLSKEVWMPRWKSDLENIIEEWTSI